MLIRRAVPDDVPSIRALEQQSETAAHWAEREYDALFAHDAPRRIALVAVEEEAGHVLGFLIARCATSEWEIENVVVDREKRKQGLGIQIVRELLKQARAGGATSVLLEVRESNVAALRLYEKIGFTQRGIRKSYYSNPEENGLLLCLQITNLRQFHLEDD